MAITWPTTLPSPIRDGASLKPNVDTKKRRVQSGRQESRRFGRGCLDILTCKILLSKAKCGTALSQLEQFVKFYEEDLNHGKNWIDAPWLCSAFRYSGRYSRIAGYTSLSSSSSTHAYYNITFHIQKTANCWPDTSGIKLII